MPEQPNHAVAQSKPNVLAQRAIKPPQKAAGQAKPAIAVAGLYRPPAVPPGRGWRNSAQRVEPGGGRHPRGGRHFLSRVNASNSQLRIASTSV